MIKKIKHATNPSITCVVNVRNREEFIRQTLLSLLDQTLPVRILVVDNYSTDNSGNIVAEFPMVEYHRTPEPFCLGRARNFGLDLVETPLVSWVDSDDLWRSDAAKLYEEAFSRETDLLAVCSGAKIIDSNGNNLRASIQKMSNEIFQGKLRSSIYQEFVTLESLLTLLGRQDISSSYVFKKKIVDKIGGFDCTLEFATDFYLICRIAGLGKIKLLRRDLVSYRIHPGNLTKQLGAQNKYGEILKICDKLKTHGYPISDLQLDRINNITNFKIAAAKTISNPFSLNFLVTLKLIFFSGVPSWIFVRMTNKIRRTFFVLLFKIRAYRVGCTFGD